MRRPGGSFSLAMAACSRKSRDLLTCCVGASRNAGFAAATAWDGEMSWGTMRRGAGAIGKRWLSAEVHILSSKLTMQAVPFKAIE